MELSPRQLIIQVRGKKPLGRRNKMEFNSNSVATTKKNGLGPQIWLYAEWSTCLGFVIPWILATAVEKRLFSIYTYVYMHVILYLVWLNTV